MIDSKSTLEALEEMNRDAINEINEQRAKFTKDSLSFEQEKAFEELDTLYEKWRYPTLVSFGILDKVKDKFSSEELSCFDFRMNNSSSFLDGRSSVDEAAVTNQDIVMLLELEKKSLLDMEAYKTSVSRNGGDSDEEREHLLDVMVTSFKDYINKQKVVES